ncbi:MAG: hypothetical protein AAGJ18_12930, partial [Bacteroidota bacterium]
FQISLAKMGTYFSLVTYFLSATKNHGTMLKKLLLSIALLGNVLVAKASTKDFVAFVNEAQMPTDTTITCEAIGLTLDFNICITDELGTTEKVNICEALAEKRRP